MIKKLELLRKIGTAKKSRFLTEICVGAYCQRIQVLMEHQMEEDISYNLLNKSRIGTNYVKKKIKTTTSEKLFICKNNDVFNQCTITSSSKNQLITVVPHSSSTNSNETTITAKHILGNCLIYSCPYLTKQATIFAIG